MPGWGMRRGGAAAARGSHTGAAGARVLFATCAVLLLGDALADSRCAHDCAHGRCVDGACKCDPGYFGSDCSRGACPNNCTQRGECVNGACMCAAGFTGEDCAIAICPNDCSAHGRCEGLRCKCDAGWSGHDCSLRTCVDDCSRHGHCYNGTCYCDHGYGGPSCQIGAPPSPRLCARSARGPRPPLVAPSRPARAAGRLVPAPVQRSRPRQVRRL